MIQLSKELLVKVRVRLHKIFGPIARWKIELRPLRDPSIKRQKMRWHALMSGDDINYSTKPTKPNFVKYERVPKEYASDDFQKYPLF